MKTNLKEVEIGDVRFKLVTTKQLLSIIANTVKSSQVGKVISTVNLDILRLAQDDPELLSILNDSWITTADGMPIVWFSKIYGTPLPERVTGADLTKLLCINGVTLGVRPFFLGAEDGIGLRAQKKLETEVPGLKIAGVYSPKPNELRDERLDRDIVQRINDSGANVLFVALGAPKQEKWIAKHKSDLEVAVIIGVGASIDFLAEKVHRAPTFIQRLGLEWFFRLCQEPRRLWRRYVKDMVTFWILAFKISKRKLFKEMRNAS